MRYVYMNNFRGFSETLLPIDGNNFLLGENSTGKSSFLKLLNALSMPQFWFSPERTLQERGDFSNYDDIVSISSGDKSSFDVGIIFSKKDKDKIKNKYEFTVHTFTNKDGSPFFSRYLQLKEGKLTKFVWKPKRSKYKVLNVKKDFSSDDEFINFFKKTVNEDRRDTKGFSLVPEGVPSHAPLPLVFAVLQSLEKSSPFKGDEFIVEFPFFMELVGFAPIRTKPQRFYDGTKKDFSPEGGHTPNMLKKALSKKVDHDQFVKNINKFGEESGLFDEIDVRAFSDVAHSPFELLVRLAGSHLNINNVGYGVSQVLPLVIEFLLRKGGDTFSVQQPEVHLHPRAQAALGELVFSLSKGRGHSFIIETHSEYLIDRFRLCMSEDEDPPEARVIYFERRKDGNKTFIVPISDKGRYPEDQPLGFREFFIKEELSLLEI